MKHCYNIGRDHDACDKIHAFKCGGMDEEKKFCTFSYIICEDLDDPILIDPMFYGPCMSQTKFNDIEMPRNCPRLVEINQLSIFRRGEGD